MGVYKMSKTIQVVFSPTVKGAHNYDLVIEYGDEVDRIALKGISMSDHRKSLRPFRTQLVPEFIADLDPMYVTFIDEFFKYLEQKNHIKFFTDDEEQWSLYQNIVNVMLFGEFETIPIQHTRLLEAFFNDYAATYNFADLTINLDDEKLRKLGASANLISRLSCTWKAYNFYVAAVSNYFIAGESKTVSLSAFYTTYDATTAPPDYTVMGDDEIVLTEIPVYRYNDTTAQMDLDLVKTASPDDYKGTDPFHYQIISKSNIMSNGAFVHNLIDNCNPAGFDVEFVYIPPEVPSAVVYVNAMVFPKIIITIDPA
jgi:hypothetical protein